MIRLEKLFDPLKRVESSAFIYARNITEKGFETPELWLEALAGDRFSHLEIYYVFALAGMFPDNWKKEDKILADLYAVIKCKSEIEDFFEKNKKELIEKAKIRVREAL